MVDQKGVKELTRKLWTDRARTFDNSPGHGMHSAQEKQGWAHVLAQALDGAQRLKVLDVGTGTGVIALLLAEMGHLVTGIDMSEKMLEVAEAKARKVNLPVEFRFGDAEDLPFEDGSFDAVVSRHVLWSLPDPHKALAEWKRVLRPGGKLVIIDGNFERHKTLAKEIWRYLAMPLILLSERRDPRLGRFKALEKYQPLRQQRRPEADVKLLQTLAFAVEVSQVRIPKSYGFFSYLKYGYIGNIEQFVVKGVKR